MNIWDIVGDPMEFQVSLKFVIIIIIVVAICTKCMCGYMGYEEKSVRDTIAESVEKKKSNKPFIVPRPNIVRVK